MASIGRMPRFRGLSSGMRALIPPAGQPPLPTRLVITQKGRVKSTLIRLPRSSQAASHTDSLPCVYIPGFLSRSAQPTDFQHWQASHEQLVASQLAWNIDSFGCSWRNGSTGDYLGTWPLPVQAAFMLSRTVSPWTLAAAATGDACAHAARMYLMFRNAETAASLDAPRLAEELCRFDGQFRVVAFSLGCRLVLETLPLLPPDKRPAEVHLCAAAVTESFALPLLPQLCSSAGKVFHYYSPADEILNTGFFIPSAGHPAVGSAPLSIPLDHVVSHDATNYMGVFVHNGYRDHFHHMAINASLGREPPEAQSQRMWQQRQRLYHDLRLVFDRWRNAFHYRALSQTFPKKFLKYKQ